jgi:hypothetical protein
MQPSFVVELIRWWCHVGGDQSPIRLAEELEFDSGLEIVGREDVLASWQYSGSHRELDVLDVWASDERAAVMFEATDEITNMRHRFCWLIAFSQDQVRRVKACAARVPTRAENPTMAVKGR